MPHIIARLHGFDLITDDLIELVLPIDEFVYRDTRIYILRSVVNNTYARKQDRMKLRFTQIYSNTETMILIQCNDDYKNHIKHAFATAIM